MDVSNVLRWHKLKKKKKWKQKRSQTDAWQEFFTETKNVWNDLDMIMQLRDKHWATQGNQKVSRGTWDAVNFEMLGAIKTCFKYLQMFLAVQRY